VAVRLVLTAAVVAVALAQQGQQGQELMKVQFQAATAATEHLILIQDQQ
jgi:hypothetical protein